MSRPAKIFRNVVIGLGALIVIVIIVAVFVVRTGWFRDTVRQKIIASTEEATGSKVEIGSFDFDLSHMRATVTDFVIHGKEPAGSAPFVQASKVAVDLAAFSSLKHMVQIRYLGIEHPQTNIMVLPDGSTNIPEPGKASTSNTSGLATVVDLAIGRFDLTGGVINFSDRKQDVNLSGTNLRALLTWSLAQHYQGQISMEPLYVVSGRNTPVKFKLNLPITLERDRISIQNASITTPQSSLEINASISNMKSPATSAHVNGHIALADLRNAGNLPISTPAGSALSAIDVDANATVAGDRIQVTGLRTTLGQSSLEASGTLQDPKGNGALQFKVDLALGELSRLGNMSAHPDGEVLLNGTAKLDAAYNYQADGNIEARNVSITTSRQRIRNVNLVSAVHADKHAVNLRGMRLNALGGELTGDASLEDFARYHFDGNVRNIDLQDVMRQLAPKQRLPYDGITSGSINVAGDAKTSGIKSLVAATRLTITPGRRGIPLSGRLNADYRGANDQVTIQNSYLSLPHTKLTLSGSPGNRLDIALTSTDLDDLLAAAAMNGSKAPVRLDHGQASFNGAATGSLTSPRVIGHVAVDHFSVEGRKFTSLNTDVAVSKSQASVTSGSLTRGPMNVTFAAQAGLHDWSATQDQRLTADLTLRNGDLSDAVALAGEQPAGYSGTLTADAHIRGTLGNPQGEASVQAANGALDGEPFDQLQARVDLGDQLVTIPAAFLTSGPSRIDLSAEFQHPRDSFATGRIHARAQSNQLDLANVAILQKEEPRTAGKAHFTADVTGTLGTTFLLTAVNADASVRGLQMQGKNYGDVTADARTSGQNVSYHLDSDFSGSTIRVNGTTQLATDYPTTADATIRNLQIAPVLVLAKQAGIPAAGTLSGTAHVSGTIKNPQGNVDLDLANANLYEEPFDHIRLKATYLADSIDVPQFEAVAGPSRVDFTAHYDHPPSDLQSGKIQFRLSSSRIDLARIRNLRKLRPGIGGQLGLSGDGAATVRAGEPRVLLTSLNANLTANGIAMQGTNLGNLTLTANTSGAGRLNMTLDSNLAGASINASGNAQLSGNYPVNARLSFKNVTWTKLEPIIHSASAEPPSFEAAADGQVTVDGPALTTNQLRGTLNVSRLVVNTISQPKQPPIVIQNDGPIVVGLDNDVIHLQSVKLTGPKTSIQAAGTASLQGQAMNLTLNANTDLSILGSFSREIESPAGSIVLAATVHGSASNPLANGTLELHNAGMHFNGFANGISNANGLVALNGNSAVVRNLTATTGGGKITATGFVGYASQLRFGLRAGVAKARIEIQPGASVITDADIHMSGTTQRSVVSGAVTIDSVNYSPQSDIGSILSRAAPPVQTLSAPSPLLENMRLDVRVRTSPALAVQAAMAQNLQANGDIRVQGTAAQPSVLGRVTISEGQLVFFGSTYTVNSGSIGFYNPIRIDPILDLSLETQSKGVDVVLHVTGPIDNMKLSYTSDPPLQFQEIISLLAAGKTPTSDPTLLANQPAEPPQTFQQMGESALVGKALADPVSSRLQRVFGVSQLKIDPTFTSGSQIPEARLTLQQQISSNVTFTYVSALNDPNTMVIRVEWAFNPRWSAVATRDENGIFSISFFYKKQFR